MYVALRRPIKMSPRLLLLVFLFIACSFVRAQSPPDAKKPEKDEKLIKAAISFLRETSADIDRMRSIENRLSFSSELASLMWFHDEKSARAMYAAAIGDFKLLLIGLDARINSADAASDDEVLGFSLFGPGKSTAQRKLTIALMVRQQIALGLAEHDPDMAYGFFLETAALVTNPSLRENAEGSDRIFEAQLMQQIAKKDAAKALQYGKGSLKDGIGEGHLELLKNIYAKDAEKGIEFGQAIVSRIKSDKNSVNGIWVYSRLLQYGTESLAASKKPDSKKPPFSEADLRGLADEFAQLLLDTKDFDLATDEFIEQIEKYSPSRGSQLRKNFKIDAPSMSSNTANAAYAAGITIRTNTNMAISNSMVDVVDEGQREYEERNKELSEGMKTLEKPLSKEEREKVVTRARVLIAKTKGADARIAGLSLLAAQVARAGDKELAAEIMLDAERLVNPLPKNYRDYLLSWLLASGYAESDPSKAFALLESTIMRANDTISAFAKVAEFIDVNEEMISNGEVQVGAFGGTVLRSMTRDLGIANTTLVSLAKADFGKMKAVTETFERLEVRVLAKMLVLRAVLDEKKPEPPSPAAGSLDDAVSKRGK